MRTYERTHPWITFRLDLMRASHRLWMALGEAQSKCERIAGVPLQPAVAVELQQLYLAKGALATTAIEGNTLSEAEALQVVRGELHLPPSKDYLGQEIVNIAEACNLIFDDLVGRGSPTNITVDSVKQFNRLVLKGLSLHEGVIPGEVRTYEVAVGQYNGAPSSDCNFLLERFCAWLNSDDFRPPDGFEIVYGLLKAIAAHLYLAWIHPFGDGNGRTARLLEFQILVGAGVPSPAAHLLSNHYNQTRQEYYRQLDRASSSEGDVLPFIEYAVQGFVDGLREQLERIRNQQWNIAWHDFVYEVFSDQDSGAGRRRRQLVLDLSSHEWVPVSEVREISPAVAAAYATKTTKTLARDIKALEEMRMIVKESGRVRAYKERILQFLPARRTQSG